MSNELVTVPQGDSPSERAQQLLAAAKSEGFGPNVVRTDTQGASQVFVVPESVAQVAGVESETYEDAFEKDLSVKSVSAFPQQGAEAEIDGSGNESDSDEPEPKKATKKAAAKKSTK